MRWNFIKYPDGMTIRDAMVGEFFSVDAIDRPAQGLVEEFFRGGGEDQRVDFNQ